MNREELLATLKAYRTVVRASWPKLHPDLEQRAERWGSMEENALQRELTDLCDEVDARSQVRVFWKFGLELKYGGGNRALARDAGKTRGSELVGHTDLAEFIPWKQQAFKYRLDDQTVMGNREPKLNIVERQNSATSQTWLRTSKAPIQLSNGKVIGIFGMYEITDRETGLKLDPPTPKDR